MDTATETELQAGPLFRVVSGEGARLVLQSLNDRTSCWESLEYVETEIQARVLAEAYGGRLQ